MSITLKIVPFTNKRTQSVSFRVTGMYLGKQLRKNFPTQQQAEVFKRGLLEKALQVQSVQIVSTRLRQEDMPRIESWAERLGGVDQLGEAVTFFERYGSPPVSYTPTEALDAYAAMRRGKGVGSRATRKGADSVEVMKSVFKKLFRQLEITDLRQMQSAKLEPWVYDTAVATSTRRDRHSWLVGFFGFLKNKKAWAGDSPMEAIQRPKHREGLPIILDLAKVQQLIDLSASDIYGETGKAGVMLTYFAVCFFTGIRPEEAKKIGHGRPVDPLKPKGDRTDGWEIVHFENRIIELPPDLVKVGGVRNVPLADNILAILVDAKAKGFPFCFFSKRVFDRVRRDAGVLADWESDVMRHCYASYHYAVHKDVKFLESAMGNSRPTLFKHYIRRTITESQGKAYAQITPRAGV